MSTRLSKTARFATLAAILGAALPAHAAADPLPNPHHLSTGGSPAETAAVTLAARRYAAF